MKLTDTETPIGTPLRKALFTIDAFEMASATAPRQFPGYTDGHILNGWACPSFTREQAHTLVAGWQALGASASYDPEADEFVFGPLDPSQGEELERYRAVDSGGQYLYPIGSGSWIWDEMEELT